MFIMAQEVRKHRRTHLVHIILFLEHRVGGIAALFGKGTHQKHDHGFIFRSRFRKGIHHRIHFFQALLEHEPLHHLQKHLLVAGRLVAFFKKFNDCGILALVQKQLELALEKRRHVIHLGQEQVVDADQFLGVLHRFQEQAVIVQQRHVLVTGSIQGGIKILAGRIGAAILHIQMGKHSQLACRRATFQFMCSLGLNQRQGIRALGHHDFGKLESQVAAVRVRFRSMLPEHIGQSPFPAQFHFLGTDKGFMGSVHILGQRFCRILYRIKLCVHRHGNRGRIRGRQRLALFRRGTRRERKRHRKQSRCHCK